MPLDNANFIGELNVANPVGSVDTVSLLDDFLRELKKVMVQSFPNIKSSALISSTELNNLRSYFKYSNNTWDLQSKGLTNVASVDSNTAVQPRSYNDNRYARRDQNLNDLTNKDQALSNILSGANNKTGSWYEMQRLVTDMTYPVGSIYINRNNGNNPRNSGLLGSGTWAPFAQGRVIVGVGSTSDTRNEGRNFNVGNTGGEFQHQLGIDEMPSHDHAQSRDYDAPQKDGYVGLGKGSKVGDRLNTRGYMSKEGGDRPHNNMQPYIACYIWVRTS